MPLAEPREILGSPRTARPTKVSLGREISVETALVYGASRDALREFRAADEDVGAPREPSLLARTDLYFGLERQVI